MNEGFKRKIFALHEHDAFVIASQMMGGDGTGIELWPWMRESFIQ
jgi:chemotaxis protein CheY-P-specific phosphatase CheC